MKKGWWVGGWWKWGSAGAPPIASADRKNDTAAFSPFRPRPPPLLLIAGRTITWGPQAAKQKGDKAGQSGDRGGRFVAQPAAAPFRVKRNPSQRATAPPKNEHRRRQKARLPGNLSLRAGQITPVIRSVLCSLTRILYAFAPSIAPPPLFPPGRAPSSNAQPRPPYQEK